MFFKIESWNFQHLFEKEFRETSQNFNSFSSFRKILFSFFLWVVWLSWNFVRFHEFFSSNRCLKFQLSILKNKKVLFLKKIFFLSCCQCQNKKALFTDPIFSEGFEETLLTLMTLCSSHSDSKSSTLKVAFFQFYSLAVSVV